MDCLSGKKFPDHASLREVLYTASDPNGNSSLVYSLLSVILNAPQTLTTPLYN